MRTRRKLGVGLVVGAVTLALAGGIGAQALTDTIPPPGADPAEFANARRPATFVGVVRGTRAFVAVRRHANEVLLYVCDGRKVFEWLKGRLARPTIRLRGSVTRLRVTARFGRRTVTGLVVFPNGRRHRFKARLATKPPAGLLRAVPDKGVANGLAHTQRVAGKTIVRGWIVLPDGRVRGGSAGLSETCRAELSTILKLQNTISPSNDIQLMDYFDKVSHFRAFCHNSLIAR